MLKSEHLCLSFRFHPSSSADSVATFVAPGAVARVALAVLVVVQVLGGAGLEDLQETGEKWGNLGKHMEKLEENVRKIMNNL